MTLQIECMLLDFAEVDASHAEFVQLLERLDTAEKVEFAELFGTLIQHTERHFDEENQLMERYSFPATAEHQGEHGRVLAELRQFQKRVDRGLLGFGYAYVRERLPQWFALYVSTMDSALIAHIKKRAG